jgi:hypothetical protein
MGTTCGTDEEKRNACRLTVGKPEGKELFKRHRPKV